MKRKSLLGSGGSYDCLACIGFLSFGTEGVLVNIDIRSIQLNKNRFHTGMYKIPRESALCIAYSI